MRIAIVNDMVLAVEALRRVLSQARGHQLAWVARNGAEAVALCSRDTPDLILMDLVMPEMDGIEATRRIMAQTPCAIVVVTATVGRHSSKVFDAMGAGALDVVDTPVLAHLGNTGGSDALLSKINLIDRLLGSGPSRGRPAHTPNGVSRSGRDRLVAIGASAGGPAALAKLLSGLPSDFPAGIVIVQHVDAHFAPGLAHWLDHQAQLRVRLAHEGDRPHPGTVLLARGGQHLVLTSPTRLGYTRVPADSVYQPSIDALFDSIRRHWAGDAIGVLLTGIGRDGAEGLKAMRDHGFPTIAQDEATSAVYGMPKAAAQLQAATEILPLHKIGPQLLRMLKRPTLTHA